MTGSGEMRLHDVLGIAIERDTPEKIIMAFAVQPLHIAPNGYLHAGALVTLADYACGVGADRNLPQGALGFSTIELKSNFLSTVRSGQVEACATPLHLGRTTQVWDAVVTSRETGKTMALFRCTQSIMWPR